MSKSPQTQLIEAIDKTDLTSIQSILKTHGADCIVKSFKYSTPEPTECNVINYALVIKKNETAARALIAAWIMHTPKLCALAYQFVRLKYSKHNLTAIVEEKLTKAIWRWLLEWKIEITESQLFKNIIKEPQLLINQALNDYAFIAIGRLLKALSNSSAFTNLLDHEFAICSLSVNDISEMQIRQHENEATIILCEVCYTLPTNEITIKFSSLSNLEKPAYTEENYGKQGLLTLQTNLLAKKHKLRERHLKILMKILKQTPLTRREENSAFYCDFIRNKVTVISVKNKTLAEYIVKLQIENYSKAFILSASPANTHNSKKEKVSPILKSNIEHIIALAKKYNYFHSKHLDISATLTLLNTFNHHSQKNNPTKGTPFDIQSLLTQLKKIFNRQEKFIDHHQLYLFFMAFDKAYKFMLKALKAKSKTKNTFRTTIAGTLKKDEKAILDFKKSNTYVALRIRMIAAVALGHLCKKLSKIVSKKNLELLKFAIKEVKDLCQALENVQMRLIHSTSATDSALTLQAKLYQIRNNLVVNFRKKLKPFSEVKKIQFFKDTPMLRSKTRKKLDGLYDQATALNVLK